MQRIRMTVAYDGTDFHGWQVQTGLRTIQGTLEEIIGRLEGNPVHVAGSGRTDAGVHALAQVAAFTLTNPIPPGNLKFAVNRLLPEAIRVLEARNVPLDFHPRFDAVSKTYEYRLFRGEVCSPFDRRYVHHHPYPCDWQRFVDLAPLLEGEHDFGRFATRDAQKRSDGSKVRRIFSSRAVVEGNWVTYRVRGSGFLKHMVRNIVGSLLQGARGNLNEDGLLVLLEGRPGRKAGPTAAASGLFLVEVEYSEGAQRQAQADDEDE